MERERKIGKNGGRKGKEMRERLVAEEWKIDKVVRMTID